MIIHYGKKTINSPVHFMNSTKTTEEITKTLAAKNLGLEIRKDQILAPQYSKDRIVQDVCEVYGIETNAGKEFLRIALENCVLMDRKQRDYGPKNISGFGMFGIVVRMNDKFERIKNLFNNKRKKAVNESIRDNLKDISNYSIIALMIESGKWPDK